MKFETTRILFLGEGFRYRVPVVVANGPFYNSSECAYAKSCQPQSRMAISVRGMNLFVLLRSGMHCVGNR